MKITNRQLTNSETTNVNTLFGRHTGATGQFNSLNFLVDFQLSEFLPQLTDSTIPRDVRTGLSCCFQFAS